MLIVVAWKMSEAERFGHLLRAPRGDRLVLLLTFGLTVLVDITVAVEVGVVLAALLFMQRMSRVDRGAEPRAADPGRPRRPAARAGSAADARRRACPRAS